MVDILKSGNNLMIFPEGTRSRQGKMLEGKKGVLLVAKMSKGLPHNTNFNVGNREIASCK